MADQPSVNLLYVHGNSLGYGRYGVHLAEALHKRGVTVFDHLPDPTADPAMAHLNAGRNSGLANVVCWVSVPTHATGWFKGQYPVISTMWEATQLPESFRETLHEFAQVIVPSRQNQELFGQYHDNVHYVPLGVDPEVWHFTPRQPHDRYFRFLIGGSGSRKGTDLAHKAFRKVFSKVPASGPVPLLIMKNPRGEDFYGERIEMVTGRISAKAERDLYASAHCYLQPSRGEGFGLQPLQALAQGCPTILTNAHGHESFADLGHRVGAELVPSDYFIYGEAGEWWEPDFDELCDQMLYVYRNYERCLGKAEHSAQIVAEEFTWDRTAERFCAALGDELDKPFTESEWYAPHAKRYLTILNQPWRAEIAGTSYIFDAGREYYELADVKRILFEAGKLDPACLGERDTGLDPSQVERIPEYSASHAFCPTCHQQLGTRPTAADLVMS